MRLGAWPLFSNFSPQSWVFVSVWPLLSHVWSLSCVFASLTTVVSCLICQVFAVCFEVTLYNWLDAKIQLLSNKLCLSLLLNFWRRKSLLLACLLLILLKLVPWALEFAKSLKSLVNSPCLIQLCSLLSLSYSPPPPPPTTPCLYPHLHTSLPPSFWFGKGSYPKYNLLHLLKSGIQSFLQHFPLSDKNYCFCHRMLLSALGNTD